MSCHLTESYHHCKQIARQAASSFFHSFLLLPKNKRRAMYALYAFFRHTDDIADDDIVGNDIENDLSLEQRRITLATWRETFQLAMTDNFTDPMMPAVIDTIRRFNIPQDYFLKAIDGAEMDLVKTRYDTFAELEIYCYQVATVVGLSCLHVWGFDDPQAIRPAEHCGLAFQLTNILRDLAEDAQRGRVYLPQEDFERFDYPVNDLLQSKTDDSFSSLMEFEIHRAESHYQQAAPLQSYLNFDGRRAFATMFTTYHDLLHLIQQQKDSILKRRISIPAWRKIAIAARCFILPPRQILQKQTQDVAAP